MDAEKPMRIAYHFDRFTLDLARGALLAPDGTELSLRPKSFALLQLLVESAGRLLDRDMIMRAIWPDVFVTDDSITQCVHEIRRVLGDEAQRLLRTVPRRGYLFAAEVSYVAAAVAAPEELPRPPTGQPTVLGQPLATLKGEPEQAYRNDMLDPPAPEHTQPIDRRKLIAVVYVDMVGYSRLIGLDDAGTLERLRALRRTLIDPVVAEHGGRIVQTGGDSLLIVFGSIDGAVHCAVSLQEQITRHDGDQPPDRAIQFRIGVNIGDAIPDGTDLHGEAVNVAVRLQTECPPGAVCVSRAVREQVAVRLDLAFEALGPLNLKNIAQPVEAFVWRPGSATIANSSERTLVQSACETLQLPEKPSLVVLPFANMSDDPEQEYFADGMVAEITTALSRIRWLFVIARNSSFTYKGQAIDVKQVGRELGVQYVLEGSVRKAGDRVRIMVQLIDTLTGAHLWADRFEGSLDAVFELQDKVAHFVAGAIEPKLEAAEIQRSSKKPTINVTAYDLYLRAIPNTFSLSKASALRALDLLGQAIDHDPCYGPALALAAWWRLHLAINKWADDEAENRHKAIELAQRALQVADDDPAALADAAGVLAEFGADIDSALASVDRALELNPSCVIAWHWSAWLRLSSGEPDLAIERFEKSLRLDPRAQSLRPIYLTGMGIAQFMRRRFEEARPLLLASLQQLPSYVTTYRFLAACYAHMGRLDEGREVIERLRALTTDVLDTATHYRDPEHRELYLSGLRLAACEASCCTQVQ